MPMMFITDGRGETSTLEVGGRDRHTIGRSSKSDIVLADPSVSRRHAELYRQDGFWWVRDCGSSNGTFVDGERIDGPHRLDPVHTVKVGAYSLRLDGRQSGPRERVRLEDRPLVGQGTLVLSAEEAFGDVASHAATSAELEAIRRRFRIVERANTELLAHVPGEELLPKVLDLVFEAVRPERAALLTETPDGDLVCRAFRGPGGEEMSVSRTVARKVMDDRASVLTADAQSDERFADGASIAIQGIRAVMAVPLWTNKEVIGLVYADSRLSSTRFGEADLKLLTMLANVAAVQMENARLFGLQLERERFEREAKAAAEIQQRLLPTTSPTIPGYLFEGCNLPCYEVGGDYYDCVSIDARRRGIVLADVAGKGMGAALLMACVQAGFRARVEAAPSPREIVAHLNDAIAISSPDNRFVTLFLLELDPVDHALRWVNAGHAPSPLVVRASGRVETLSPGGMPLGILAGSQYRGGELDLGPGDFVFACSDGVTDTEDPDGEMFGEDRLQGLLTSLAGRTPQQIRGTVESALGSFARGTPRPDDLTFVILQREGPPG